MPGAGGVPRPPVPAAPQVPGATAVTVAAAGAASLPAMGGVTPLPDVIETGNPAVDAALARLAAAGDVPGEARAGVYGEVHDLLRDTLAGLDERQSGAPTPLNVMR
jgi:hypothetical protein